MKIQYLSDVHGNIDFWDDFEITGDLLITAGDMGNCPNFDVPWLWVDGNHEWYRPTYPRPKSSKDLCLTSTRINGVLFLGCTLWSDSIDTEQLNDRSFLDFDKTCFWHQLQVSWLMNCIDLGYTKDSVIITHNAPSFRSANDNHNSLTSAFCNNMDMLVERSEAKLWIHGHTHRSCDYMIGKTRVVSNQVGHSWEKCGYEKGKTIEVG